MTELKPCPFCGEPEEHESNCYILMIARVIEDYWKEIPLYTDEELEEAWNTRAERTCKPEVEHHGGLILTRYPCCGYELKVYRYSPYPEVAFNNCPNCGAKVVW